MHVRFRPICGRLVVTLEVYHRERGKPQTDHLATLGRPRLTLTAAERAWFWAELGNRFRRLDPPISDEDRRKAIDEIHARIPRSSKRELQKVTAEMARQIGAIGAFHEQTVHHRVVPRHLVERFERGLPAREGGAIGGQRHDIHCGEQPEQMKSGSDSVPFLSGVAGQEFRRRRRLRRLRRLGNLA